MTRVACVPFFTRDTQSASHTQLTLPHPAFILFLEFLKKKDWEEEEEEDEEEEEEEEEEEKSHRMGDSVKFFPSIVTTRHGYIKTPIAYYCLSQLLKRTGWKKIFFSHTSKLLQVILNWELFVYSL